MKFQIIFSKRFLKDAKNLKKKYKNLEKDLLNFVESIEEVGLAGDKLRGLSGFDVCKMRIKNSSAKVGKSGGFRIIYYVRNQGVIYLITIYSKSEKENILLDEILEILKQENLA